MTKERLRAIIGENVRNERVSRDISLDELAELLELTPGFMGLIERGRRGTTSSTLFKLADVFGIPIDELFYRSQRSSLSYGEDEIDARRSKRKKISSLISNFNEKELDFVLLTIRSLRSFNELPQIIRDHEVELEEKEEYEEDEDDI